MFVVVNTYHHFDRYGDDLKLDLKRLSARHDGKVVLMNIDARRRPAELTRDAVSPPDVRVMFAGEQLAQFRGNNSVWKIDELITTRKGDLADPIRQAAAETDPYAESLRKDTQEFVPEGISLQ